jgi:hypothetical protein
VKKISLFVLAAAASTLQIALAQTPEVIVNPQSGFAVSPPLTEIALRPESSKLSQTGVMVVRPLLGGKFMGPAAKAADIAPNVSVPALTPYTQTATYQGLDVTLGANFEGLGLGTPGFSISGAPPDPTVAVSPTQVVQWVNSQFAIYNKAGVPLLPSPGFLNGNSIWQALGAGSLCAGTNRGDPMVQYDRISQRWIFSQFAFSAGFAQNSQCFAVSKTSDALGAYNLYEYSFGNVLPDYAKLGVWTDAYYMSYNMFTTGSTFSGGRACAYDKPAMLAGTPATSVCFNSTARFSFMPADFDGTILPPAGSPAPFISWDWAFVAGPPAVPYKMQLTKFKPNFVTPALSTFNDGFGGATFSFVEFPLDNGTIASCADNGNACVPQLGTTQLLDTLGSRHMYRLAYRNFGTHDAILATQSVDPAGAAVAAVRWWEIRNPNAATPVVYQNSTYSPGTENRWMSSAAFDKRGNIAIGYSESTALMNPAIKATGRLRNDPKNLLRSEITLQAGGGSQTTTLSRWGDYTAMQIDPADDCTFWYTNQYIGSSGTFNWRTRIASFRFPNCQ